MPEKTETTVKATVPFRTIAHFYDADDPSPKSGGSFPDRAETQIFHEVLDAPRGSRKAICERLEISLPASELTPGLSDSVIAAIRSHFQLRSAAVRRDMRLTQRIGLREFRLTVAVCIPSFIGIAVCSQFKGNPVAEVFEQVLVIFCWVTIWQPFQALVFDRWTLSGTAKVYEKIAAMDIRVRPV